MAISPDHSKPEDGNFRPKYDFHAMEGVTRGKYASRYAQKLRLVRLADDVADAFADEAAVNQALRDYLRTRPAV